MDWVKYGRIVSSRNKKKVLLALTKPKTPTEVSRQIRIARSTVSRTLIELETLGVAKCLTKELRMGRVYTATKEGAEIQKALSD